MAARTLGEGRNEEGPSPIFLGVLYGPQFIPTNEEEAIMPSELELHSASKAAPPPNTPMTPPVNCSDTLTLVLASCHPLPPGLLRQHNWSPVPPPAQLHSAAEKTGTLKLRCDAVNPQLKDGQ